MIMNIKIFNRKKTPKIIFQDLHPNDYAPLLSSCPSWIILMASGLLLIQTTPSKAMDGDSGRPRKSLQHSRKSEHPLTQEFWKERGVSERLKKLKPWIEQIKENIIQHKTNFINFTDDDIERCKEIFNCLKCDTVSQSLSDIHHNIQLLPSDEIEKITTGRSGNDVIIVRRDKKNLIAIKKFNNIKQGLEELFHSLIALDINPLPQELKMARIYDAVLCPNNCLNIIMEAANSHDIHHFLSTKSIEDAENVVRACAGYLSIFHIKNYHKLNKINRKKHIEHASFFFNTLSKNPLKEEADKEIAFLSLVEGREIPDLEKVTSNNIIRLLCPANQEKFVQNVHRTCKNFEDNSGKTYRTLSPDAFQSQEPYFLTITHGDAHGNNFFYDAAKLIEIGPDIPKDSLHRVTMIDFSSITITYGDIGDPAEDVGRFLGSLWDWAVQQNDTEQEFDEKTYAKMHNLQTKFLETYLQKIEESNIFTEKNQRKIFERTFKENYNFYKLRFYRAVFNSEKNKEIKLKLLKSWIKENSETEQEEFNVHPQKSIKRNLLRERPTILSGDEEIPNKQYIPHFLPDPVEGFIETAPEKSEKSYLEILREKLHQTGVATLSSTATIAGEGGIGKTSLALEYAHRTNDYDLIYWLPSGSYFSLFKGYRELLIELGCSMKDIKNTGDDHIIPLVKRYLQNKGKCLLIYDNVPDATFLENIIPENTHILITSRCNEGWKQHPLMLEVFRPEDSINYFLNITGLKDIPENQEVAGGLAEQLGHLPLALAHAAHYIKLEGGDEVLEKHFKDYLEGFKKISVEYFEEKKNPFTEEKSKITHENLIARTLRMAEAYAKSHKQPIAELAKKLLGYCAYLDSDSLTAELFPEYDNNHQQVKDALKLLASLSLIKKVQDETWTIHPLVQLVMREEKESKKNQEYKAVFASIIPLFKTFFTKNIDSYAQIDKLTSYLLPHVCPLLEHANRLGYSSPEISDFEGIGKVLYTYITKETIKEKYNLLLHNHKILEQEIADALPQYMKRKSKLRPYFVDLIKKDNLPDWVEQIVEQGPPGIQMALNFLYTCGIFVNQNKEKSFYWCKKAAKQGDIEAQFVLATIYAVEQNINESQFWGEKAAASGHPIAKFALGGDTNSFDYFSMAAANGDIEALFKVSRMYAYGKGVKQDSNMALEMCIEAANGGNRDAQFELGTMHAYEQGVEKNLEKAIKFYTMAANQKHVVAQLNLGLIYEEMKDYDKAIKYYTMAADQDHVIAQNKLGAIYGTRGTKEDDLVAFNWFAAAAAQSSREAQFALGLMFANGTGVKKDLEDAIECYTMAANQNHVGAQYNLGAIYKEMKDYDKAIEFYLLAANQNHVGAQFILGLICEEMKDYDKAIKFYTMAANQDYLDAQYHLGLIYEEMKDYDKAIKYYLLAEKKNHLGAQKKLELMHNNFINQEKGLTLKVRGDLKYKKFLTAIIEMAEQLCLSETEPKVVGFISSQLCTDSNENSIKTSSKLQSSISTSGSFGTGELRDKIKNSYNEQGKFYFSLSMEYTNKRWVDLAEHCAAEANMMYTLAENVQSTEELQKQEAQWHLKMEVLQKRLFYGINEKAKKPATKIIQQSDKKYGDADDRLLEEACFDLESNIKDPDIVQQYPENTPLISKPFGGKGKEEMGAIPVKKQQDDIKEYPHKERLSNIETQIKKPATKVVRLIPENNMQHESMSVYTSQGDAYISAAIRHADERRLDLAAHLAEEADKKYELAEDAKLAKKLSEEEPIGSTL